MKNKSILFIILLSFLMTEANAYIDPGTGSFILQAIITFFAAVVFYLGYPIRYIKQLYKKIFKKEEIEVKKDLNQNNKNE